jgi:hypothetical protein
MLCIGNIRPCQVPEKNESKRSLVEHGVMKPCPFCGHNEPIIEKEDCGYVASCEGPDCLVSIITYETNTLEEALAIWNKRVS